MSKLEAKPGRARIHRIRIQQIFNWQKNIYQKIDLAMLSLSRK